MRRAEIIFAVVLIIIATLGLFYYTGSYFSFLMLSALLILPGQKHQDDANNPNPTAEPQKQEKGN